jgi:hypothetical protein
MRRWEGVDGLLDIPSSLVVWSWDVETLACCFVSIAYLLYINVLTKT